MKNALKIILTFLVLFFGNKTQSQELETYLRIAAENNPKLQSAYTQFEAALLQSPQVASLPDPTLTVSAFGRMIETRLGAQEARFNLMQMFPWFGTLKAKAQAADLMAEARFQEYLAMRGDLFYEVKKAYAELYELEKTIELKEENLEILDSYRELSLSKFRSGSSSMVNVVRVDIIREEAITEIELEHDALESLKKQFNYLLNRKPKAAVSIQDTLVLNALGATEMEEIDFDAHPELARYDSELEAYQSRAEIAQKEGLPMLGLGVDYSIISKRTDANPEMNGQDAIMPMFSVSLPIFRKKYKAAEREAELMQTAAIQNREARENELLGIYEQTRYEQNKAQKLLDLYDRQIISSNQANNLLVSGFGNNTEDFEEVLRMNQDILMLNTQKLAALKNGFIAQAKLEYLATKTENYDENK
ncbi:TolC family protein [Salegentibacter flavus]|uniref:Outer membrane protein TolC n=1 Tax=Salegentibacter flavus TaxID=287099 RepID=A0A1I5AHI1_9FLAO|nr:TolC family protein [Salegentibacter flavus]SFN61679.1 Outer membrane protein TolC [Salegentibacter flavus]